MGYYYDIYLKTYVLLLTDTFESQISTSMNKYALDLCHYISASSLTLDTLLKLTKEELELISDVHMHNFVESGSKGGASTCGGI